MLRTVRYCGRITRSVVYTVDSKRRASYQTDIQNSGRTTAQLPVGLLFDNIDVRLNEHLLPLLLLTLWNTEDQANLTIE